MSSDLLALARARRAEIAKQIADLQEEDGQLASFMETAVKLEARLKPSPEPQGVFADLAARKATKKDVVEMALAFIRDRKGGAVTTGEIVDALVDAGLQVGGGSSSPSSVVSANLSASPEIARNPEGAGWVAKEPGWLDQAIAKTM
jgi:hypothetical protein